MRPSDAERPDADVSLRVRVAAAWADIVGALLMDLLGPYAEESNGAEVPETETTLVFYPDEDTLTDDDILAVLPDGMVAEAGVNVERRSVARDWVDGWKDHFHPVVIGRVRVRPPWESPPDPTELLVDVVINPGLGFGTGLHPTTRGTLTLLQDEGVACVGRSTCGPLVDAGTGSGILSIAAAKLGWGPVTAFDNDYIALTSMCENVKQNGVEDLVESHECDVLEAPLSWFEGATVLANMTLGPVLLLVDKLKGSHPLRVVVSGVLAGEQEGRLVGEAAACGFDIGPRLYEAEWVSMELLCGFTNRGA